MNPWANLISGILVPVLGLLFGYVVAGWSYGFGPVIWIRRAAGRSRARRDDTSRRRLVEQVRQLLPQANDGNVVFSILAERSTRSGSQFQVTSETYQYHVFVAELSQLWVIPFFFDRKRNTWDLGTPVALTRDLIRDVRMIGQPGKKLTVTFRLKPEVGLQQVVMVLEPFQFRKNRFYPFYFFQAEACERAQSAAESIALSCGRMAEDLEEDQKKEDCMNLSVTAGFCGFLGMGAASGGFLLPTLALFAAALVLICIILSKGRTPAGTAAVLLLEAAGAWLFLR